MKSFKAEERRQMIDEIQRFFADEREEDIGEVAASQVLAFITQHLGRYYYNQGVRDSRDIAVQRAQTLEEDLFALEKRG
ncbi:DUF2164 domain-containing protein [Bacillus pumilus]|nr:DUF2164 domain-containing protein [Bacillus pumilus]OLP64459.1 hypothetical protein BACPU_23830 [Bacillus pumilus]